MSTSVMIHGVNSVTTNGVSYNNSNAVTLTIRCKETTFSLTLFDLPTHVASHIDSCLSGETRTIFEERIRQDERRKIADKLGLCGDKNSDDIPF